MAAERIEKYLANIRRRWIFILYICVSVCASVYSRESKFGGLAAWLWGAFLLFFFLFLHAILIAKIRCASIMEDDAARIGYVPFLNTFWLLRLGRHMARCLGLEKKYRAGVAGTFVLFGVFCVLFVYCHQRWSLIFLVVGLGLSSIVLGKKVQHSISVALMAYLPPVLCGVYFLAPDSAELLHLLLIMYILTIFCLAFNTCWLILPPPPATSQETPSG